MSVPNIRRISLLLRFGLVVILALTFLIGLLLMMSAIHPPKVAFAQVSATIDGTNPLLVETGYGGKLINVVQVTPEEGVTSTYTETSTVQEPFTTVVVITPTAISHEFYGAGVHIFDTDHHTPNLTDTLNLTSTLDFTSSLAALELKSLRAPFGPNWDHEEIPDPPACNDETYSEDSKSMYDFIELNFNGDYPDRLTNAISTSNIAQNLGIEIIFLNWRAHTTWLTDTIYKELKEEYVDDYACFVTQVVKFLTDEGVTISYLEPTNEPSDTHDTKISPERYNTFVKLLRTYLDVEGLAEVRILGPGLAYLNHNGTCEDYVAALDDEGVAAIWAWAFHAWDPKYFPEAPEEDILRIKWKECHTAIKEREGSGPPKPIFITEYACVNDPGNEICAVKNTLTLLDQGANVIVYWYLREQSWEMGENRVRALLTETYGVKPMFAALASVLPFISGDDVGVLETQIDDRITAASFYKAGNGLGEEQIIVVLVNSYPESETILIDIIDPVGGENGVVYTSNLNTMSKGGGSVPCQADGNRTQCQLSLQPNTIMTFIFPGHDLYMPLIIKDVKGG